MKKMNFDEYQSETLENAAALLSDISRLQDGTIKIRSFNQEEVIELAQPYSGRRYYSYAQNQAVLYLKED